MKHKKAGAEHTLKRLRSFIGKRRPCVLALFCLPVVLLVSAQWLFPLPVSRLHPEPSTVVLDRNGEMLRAFLAPDDMWRIHAPAEAIPAHLKKAVLEYEDRFFYRHWGINPVSVLRAAVADLLAGRFVQGASTITMQVARLMRPKARTIPNKILEAFRALQLEWRYSKEEILTFYLNMAPYGGNLVGVGAASRVYFGKRPEQLSLGEAALLAALPNSPNLLRPDWHPHRARRARDKILEILHRRGKVSASQKEEAQSEPVPRSRRPIPFEAPHFCRMLKQVHPGKRLLRSTIDLQVQKLARSTLRNHLKTWRGRGVSNGAVVVLDNADGSLLALVGSYDFFDRSCHGQVNGATAPRSPGSALKPFVYALGMERGAITARSILFDVPVSYSGYEPVNYDQSYHGPVSVQEALVRSLNIPAVQMDARLGENGLHAFLNQAGMSTLTKPREHYGLSLVLGGCEVTLLELTTLYSGLARRGRFAPYRTLLSTPRREGDRLLRPGVCFILTEILSRLRRPDLPSTWHRFTDLPKVAWKTGTSYGHRDAWSIGFTPRLTIGVWVGNFDGKGAPGLVGAEAAAPVLFSLFNALEDPSDNRWFIKPPDVHQRRVCSKSGLPASSHCPSTRWELYIPGVSPNQVCQLHRMIWIDKATGKRLYPYCRVGREYEARVVERWPARIATWLRRNGYPVDAIPEQHPRCTKMAPGEAPIIHSPAPGSEYHLRPGVPLKYQKILLDASISNQAEALYWFLDGELVFSGDPAKRAFIAPEPGSHTVICMDEEGRSARARFAVVAPPIAEARK